MAFITTHKAETPLVVTSKVANKYRKGLYTYAAAVSLLIGMGYTKEAVERILAPKSYK